MTEGAVRNDKSEGLRMTEGAVRNDKSEGLRMAERTGTQRCRLVLCLLYFNLCAPIV